MMSYSLFIYKVDPGNYDIPTCGYEADALTSELRVQLFILS